MQPCTIGTLAELEDASWFSRVGIKDSETAIVLSSWPEAMKHSKSLAWENLRTEATNQFSERLFQLSRERFNLWNDVVSEVKKVTNPLVKRKTAAVVRDHNLPEVFETRVRIDIIGICVESEYADVCPPGFFASHAYWYLHGHFPCGWQGGFPPEGRPVIY
jgi:hypothetical protein